MTFFFFSLCYAVRLEISVIGDVYADTLVAVENVVGANLGTEACDILLASLNHILS